MTAQERMRQEERDDHTPPLLDFVDTEYGPQAKLFEPQRLQLLIDMRRYYEWLALGRPVADPWDSGAAGAMAYDGVRIKRHKPHGGYDAGRCSEPETPDLFLRIDDALASIEPFQRDMLYQRYALAWPRRQIATYHRLTDKQYIAAWQWVTRWLYRRLHGQ